MNKMSISSRVIVGIGSLALIAMYFLPVWFIYLIAPQYPEGLTMTIWLDKIAGQVDIINGLNHYIGMKHIHADMFPEFSYLIYIVAGFILFGLVVAISGKRKWLFAYLITSVVAGIVAMYDFYLWGYDYGHNLDPKAAIQVPGLFYQPPIIGHKTLLNFDAYSYPDVGGWVIIIVTAIFSLVWFFEKRKSKKAKMPVTAKAGKMANAAIVILMVAMVSCQSGPQPIAYGKDICTECKMTIMDKRFGSEIITKKGKVFKFDDIHCLIRSKNNNLVKAEDISKVLVVDFEQNDQFLEVQSLSWVLSPQLKSPMLGNAAAFSNRVSAEKLAGQTDGKILEWDSLQHTLMMD